MTGEQHSLLKASDINAMEAFEFHHPLNPNSEIYLRFLGRAVFVWQNSLKGYQSIYLEVLEQRRNLLNKMNRRAEFDEELIRKYLLLIDVEEFKVREISLQESDAE